MTRLLKYAKIAHGTNVGTQLGEQTVKIKTAHSYNNEWHKMLVALSCQQAEFVNNLGMDIKLQQQQQQQQ